MAAQVKLSPWAQRRLELLPRRPLQSAPLSAACQRMRPETPSPPRTPLHLRGAAPASARRQLLLQPCAVAGPALSTLFDPLVFAATCGAIFKLAVLTAAVGWLLQTRRIPNSTATVMSKVSFWIFIPCMIFKNVSATLASQPDMALLGMIAAVALIQIAVGGICAGLLSPLVDGSYSRKLRLFGWHPSEPRESAKAIAASTALATGAPLVANAIVPKPKAPPQGMRDIVAAACTFGNSFTLPCVFFASLLPPDLFHRAIGYAGLFLLAWSPCLWTVGLRLVSRQETALAPGASSGQEDEGGANRMLAALTAAKGFLAAVINPPLAGCLAGLAVGLSPLGQSLLANSGPALAAAAGAADALPAAAGASFLPLELRLLRGAVQAVLDVIRLLADGTLATQVVVLAAALLQRPEESVPADEPTVRQTPTSTVAGNTGMFAALLGAILPSDSAEARALVVVAVSRHILVPLSTLAVLHVLSKTVLSRMAVDPVLLFVLLVQAVMPPAQNLVVLLQLSPATRRISPTFTRMLLKLYLLSVVPVTAWVTCFATMTGIPIL